jgi:dehydration protein DpgD
MFDPGSLTRIRYEMDEHVARITLNRPEALNAMDIRMHEELGEVWEHIESDENVWVAVLTGAGDRAFSVGQDLKELARRNAKGEPAVSSFGSAGKPGAPRLTDRFDLTKPLIAQVRGFALGGGFELALACDLIIAATDAQFALPEVRLGLIAGAGGLFRLPRQIPPRIALGYALTGRIIDASQAAAWGLVNEVAAPEALEECTQAWLADILAAAALAVRAARQAVWQSLDKPLPEAFSAEYSCEQQRRRSLDAIEGPAAFAAKRPPQWLGR